MTDNLIFGDAYLLSGFDTTMVAGGYQDEQLGDGGGPSSAETTIENMFASWSAPLVANGTDEWTSYMADGAMFHDSDGNGYFDRLEKGVDGGVCTFDPATNSWIFRAYEDNDVS
jgi:hypothetical protein